MRFVIIGCGFIGAKRAAAAVGHEIVAVSLRAGGKFIRECEKVALEDREGGANL